MCHTAAIPCQISALIAKVDKKTGKDGRRAAAVSDQWRRSNDRHHCPINEEESRIHQKEHSQTRTELDYPLAWVGCWEICGFPKVGFLRCVWSSAQLDHGREGTRGTTIFNPNVILSIPNKKAKRKQRRAEKTYNKAVLNYPTIFFSSNKSFLNLEHKNKIWQEWPYWA